MKLNVTERIHGAILCCYPSLKAEKYTDFIFCSRISDQFLRVIQLLPIHKKGSSPFRKSLRCESNFLWNKKKLKFPFLCLRKKRVILIWQLCPSLVKKKNNYRFVLKYLFLLNCTETDVHMHFLLDMYRSWDYHSFQSLRMLDC